MSSRGCHRLLLLLGLFLALVAWAEGGVTLYYVEEGTIKRLPEGSKTPTNISRANDTRAWALAWDPVETRLYFSDFALRHINSTRPDGTDHRRLKQLGIKAEPYGLAIDSASRLLFYTDAKNKVIMMQTLRGGLTRTVKTEELDLPRAITLDTVKGIVYYTDYGLRPAVAKVNYDGTEGKVLIDKDMGLPTGIALDQPENLLYWCDALFDRISSYNVVTGESRLVFQMTQVTFLDLKLFDNHLYFSLYNHSKIERLSLDGTNRTQVEMDDGLKARVTSVILVDDQSPPSTPPPCNCSHICVPSPSGQRKCVCPDGLSLKPDGITCSVDPNLDNFLLFADVGLDQLFRIDVPSARYVPLPVEVGNPWGITFNILNNRVYWTEVSERSIRSAGLDGSNPTTVLKLGPDSIPYGLDVDAKEGLIFYSDAGHRVIGKMALNGSNLTTVLSYGLNDTRCLVLDIVDKVIFYTDRGSPPKIARVNYDGSGNQTLVSTFLASPIGLALDKDAGRIYWCDYTLQHIDSTDLSGRNRVRLLQFLITSHYALTLFQRVLYFTDLNVEHISQVGTHGVGYSAFSDNVFFYIVDLHGVDRNQERQLMGLPTVVPPTSTTTQSTTTQPTTATTTERTTTFSTTPMTTATTSATTTSPTTTTMVPEVKPAHQTGALQTAGYSAGAMAGAIIATILILLAFLILVAVLLYKRRHITLHRASPEGGNPGGLAFFNPMSMTEPYRTLEEEGGPVRGHHNPAMISGGAVAMERSPPPTYSSAQAPSKAELAQAQAEAGEGAVGGVAVTLPSYGKE